MSHFVVFDVATGQIAQSCQAPSMESAQGCAQAGQCVLEVAEAVDNTAVYVDAGELAALPTAPTSHHVFDWATKEWNDPRTKDTQWVLVRTERDKRLSATDWVVSRAFETGAPVPPEWQAYRQTLRDITEQPDPFAIDWPGRPA